MAVKYRGVPVGATDAFDVIEHFIDLFFGFGGHWYTRHSIFYSSKKINLANIVKVIQKLNKRINLKPVCGYFIFSFWKDSIKSTKNIIFEAKI